MHPTYTIGKGGDFGSLQGWADPENLERWDLIEAKANIFNNFFYTYTALLNHISYIGCLLMCVCKPASRAGCDLAQPIHLPIVQSSSVHWLRVVQGSLPFINNFSYCNSSLLSSDQIYAKIKEQFEHKIIFTIQDRCLPRGLCESY